MNRVRSLPEVFKEMFQIGGRKFWKMFLVSAVYAVLTAAFVVAFLQELYVFVSVWEKFGLDSSAYLLQNINSLLLRLGVYTLFVICVYPFLEAYMYHMVFSELNGEDISIGEGMHRAAASFGKLLVNELCMFLLALVGLTPLIPLCLWLFQNMGAVLLIILYMLVYIFAFLHVCFATPYTIHTGRFGFSGIFRSIGIFCGGNYGKNLGYSLLLQLLCGAVTGTFSQISSFSSSLSQLGILIPVIIAISFISALAGMVVFQFRVAGNTLIYLNGKNVYDAWQSAKVSEQNPTPNQE